MTRRERRERLINDHLKMVERIAGKVLKMFTHSGQGYALQIDIDDMIGYGHVGLVEAARRYRPSMGPFEHFAYFRIRGAIIDAYRRRAYREEMHDSVEAINEEMGFLPAHLTTDRGALPDELADQARKRERLRRAVATLPGPERVVMERYLAGERLADTAHDCGRSLTWARGKLTEARRQVTALVLGRAA